MQLAIAKKPNMHRAFFRGFTAGARDPRAVEEINPYGPGETSRYWREGYSVGKGVRLRRDRVSDQLLRLVYQRPSGVRVESVVITGYIIRQRPEALASITCLDCGFTSANQADVEHRYCARCKRFHEST